MVIYQTLTMAFTKERFPLIFQDKDISISDNRTLCEGQVDICR
jgi:hypothetical protein